VRSLLLGSLCCVGGALILGFAFWWGRAGGDDGRRPAGAAAGRPGAITFTHSLIIDHLEFPVPVLSPHVGTTLGCTEDYAYDRRPDDT
jgi:hypothetical protein